MKPCLPALFLLFVCYHHSFCQTDTVKMIAAIEKKLADHSASVSAILTDSSYEVLHPATAFRDLIKKYADAKVITISKDKEPGKKIKVTATITGADGKPVSDALVYLYQTDARGWYAADAPHVQAYEGDMRHARLFGYVRTDKNGRIELHTVKPSGYPQSDLPAHIHVHVWAGGYEPFVNEFLFDDDERLVGTIRTQAIRNRFIIAKPETGENPYSQKFHYSVTLKRQ